MYIKINNGTAQNYTIGQLRKDNPGTSFPKSLTDDLLAEYSVYRIVYGVIAEYDSSTHKPVRENATQIDGVWTYPYTITALSEDELAAAASYNAANVRSTRDAKLTETDWTGMSDVTMASDMATYRQALRDITSHANFPNLEDADWPEAP